MIDHFGIRVGDFDRARSFYTEALAPLGYRVLVEITPEMSGGHRGVGFGADHPDFWIGTGEATVPVHIAFRAKDRATVDAFYRAAIAAGGKDNGAPGLRPHYHPNYYAAFVLAPDGNNVEAVCHTPG